MWASFWGEEVPHVGNLYAKVMDNSVRVLFLVAAVLHICDAVVEAPGATGGRGGAIGAGGSVVDSATLQLRVRVPGAEVLAESVEDGDPRLGFAGGARDPRLHQLAFYI
ncbi:hypothetical protein U1Q18_050581 [Sarracenia purpurea var. burkii]